MYKVCMIDWDRYPMVRFTMMLTIGILLSAYFFHQDFVSPVRAFVACCLLLLVQIMSHHTINAKGQSVKGQRLNRYSYFLFGFSSLLFTLLFGFIIGTHSIRNAYSTYGPNWKYELYSHNQFQNEDALALQSRASSYFTSEAFGGREGCVVKAMTLGDKSNLSKEEKRRFAKAGISHVLAVSGFHLTQVYLILVLPFMILAGYSYKRYLKLLSCVVLFAYAMLTGMPPSMSRAIIMFCLATLFSMDNEQHLGLNNCVTAAAIMLIASPVQLFHIGFQLSFAAMMGICMSISYISRFRPVLKNRLLTLVATYVVSTTLVSIVCNVFTLPLVVYHFHQIPLFSLFSNLVVSVIVPLIMFLGLLWWGFCWLSPASLAISKLLFFLTHQLLVFVDWVSSLPYSVLYVG